MKRFLSVVIMFMSILGMSAQIKVDRGEGENQGNVGRFIGEHRGSQLAIRYGIKAGMNISTMSNSMEFDPEFKMGVGFRIGAMANFHWGQRTASSLPGTGWFGFQPELMYSYQSVKSDGGNINMHYIQLPIMLKIYPLAALSVEVGPEFNYLLSIFPKELTVAGATIKTGDCNGFSIGAGVGVAYELESGFNFGARYSLDFSNMAKNLKWKNNGNIQITVGWLF